MASPTPYMQKLYRFQLDALADHFVDFISPRRGALLQGEQAIAKVPADLLEVMRISGVLLVTLPEGSVRGFPAELLEDPDPVNRWMRAVFFLIEAYNQPGTKPLRDFLAKKISPRLTRIANIARASWRALDLLADLVEHPEMWISSEAPDRRVE